MKRPAFQFYPADWRKDAALQSCSMAAQGLWINAMCIAHECEPYGHLVINGRPMKADQLGRLVGLSTKECERLVGDLVVAGVISITDNGAYFSRRMVADESLRNIRAEAGRLGGNPLLLGKKVNQKPTPSSSSSSSSSKKEKAQAPAVTGLESVSEQVMADFKTLRKAKRLPLTQTAVDGLLREAQKAGLSIADAVKTSVENSWAGFKAEWLKTPQAQRADVARTTVPLDPRNLYKPEPAMTVEEREASDAARKRVMAARHPLRQIA